MATPIYRAHALLLLSPQVRPNVGMHIMALIVYLIVLHIATYTALQVCGKCGALGQEGTVQRSDLVLLHASQCTRPWPDPRRWPLDEQRGQAEEVAQWQANASVASYQCSSVQHEIFPTLLVWNPLRTVVAGF